MARLMRRSISPGVVMLPLWKALPEPGRVLSLSTETPRPPARSPLIPRPLPGPAAAPPGCWRWGGSSPGFLEWDPDISECGFSAFNLFERLYYQLHTPDGRLDLLLCPRDAPSSASGTASRLLLPWVSHHKQLCSCGLNLINLEKYDLQQWNNEICDVGLYL